jgi:hypothetical protein
MRRMPRISQAWRAATTAVSARHILKTGRNRPNPRSWTACPRGQPPPGACGPPPVQSPGAPMERLPLPSWVPPLLGLLAAAAVFTLGSQPAIAAIAAVAAGVAGWAIGSRAELLLGRADEDRLALKRGRDPHPSVRAHSPGAQRPGPDPAEPAAPRPAAGRRPDRAPAATRRRQPQLPAAAAHPRARDPRPAVAPARGRRPRHRRRRPRPGRRRPRPVRGGPRQPASRPGPRPPRPSSASRPRGNVGNSARELEALHDELEALQRTASETRARLSAELEHLRETHERAQTELRQSQSRLAEVTSQRDGAMRDALQLQAMIDRGLPRAGSTTRPPPCCTSSTRASPPRRRRSRTPRRR